jgi:hypothetical protein
VSKVGVLRPTGAPLITRDKISSQIDVSHLPCFVEVDVGALKRGVGVGGAIVVAYLSESESGFEFVQVSWDFAISCCAESNHTYRMRVGLHLGVVPILTVRTKEMRTQGAASTVLVLLVIICMANDMPIASLVDPPAFKVHSSKKCNIAASF